MNSRHRIVVRATIPGVSLTSASRMSNIVSLHRPRCCKCQCPCQESNLVYDLRRVACFRYTSRTISTHPRNRTLPDGFEDRCASTTLVGRNSSVRESNPVWQLRRLPCHPTHSPTMTCFRLHQPEPTTGFAPACFRLQDGRLSQSATSAISTSVRIRTPCSGFGDHPLSQEHARVRPPSHNGTAAVIIHPVPRSSTPR